ATETVSLRAFSFSAIRSACGSRSCNIACLPRVPVRSFSVPRRLMQAFVAAGDRAMDYQTILYAEDGPVGTLTLNRPDDGNIFTETKCHEVRDCINTVRRE